mgnify:CR=1 FL=1
MKNTMKRRMIALVAAVAVVVSLSGCNDNYDETPPLTKDYLTTYIMPDGIFLGDADWAQIASEEDEYDAFLNGSK